MASPHVADVFITDELPRRPVGSADYLREKLAMQDLARQMVEHPGEVLPKLVSLAMEICGAASAGLSLYEPLEGTPGIFRWHHLVGILERFNGATTPRDFSPCGICLDQGRPTLAVHPERVYDWIADAGIVVPEVLLVPLFAGKEKPLGTLWIVAHPGQQFNSNHSRVAGELASFAGIAFKMIEHERHLTLALDQQQAIAREMSHRIGNLFAITAGLVVASERAASTPKEMSKILNGRLSALTRAHSIVRNIFTSDQNVSTGDLETLCRIILQPYDTGRTISVSGPALSLSESSVNSIGLVLHELATNAVKYGALFEGRGRVAIEWRVDGGDLGLTWTETGGPQINGPPERSGFGSELTRMTVSALDGAIDYDWRSEGLTVEMTCPVRALSR